MALMGRLAPWLALAAVGLLLLTLASPGAEGGAGPVSPGAGSVRPTPYDVPLALGPYFFNPSIVRHRGVYLSTARTAHMKRIEKTNWWFNEGYICMSTGADFASASCRRFDPWAGRFQECLWGSERRVADVDTQGVEDPKLFVWPGRGVYAVFGRKPEALGSSPYCRDPIFVQFLVQVVSEGSSSSGSSGGDEWAIHRPRELKTGAFGPPIYRELAAARGGGGGGGPIKEKNWMPFVHSDRLYMAHSVVPHRVFRINSQGVAVQQFVTANDALFAPFAGQDVHGGPPVVLIDGPLLPPGAEPYYLGVFHFFVTSGSGSAKVKAYHHYAYKAEARPPFRVCAVSDEIELVTRKRGDNGGGDANSGGARDWTHQRIWKDTSQTAYVSGLFVDADGTVLMSYGSSDIDARLLALGMADVEALFRAPFDCSGARVIDAGSGEAPDGEDADVEAAALATEEEDGSGGGGDAPVIEINGGDGGGAANATAAAGESFLRRKRSTQHHRRTLSP